MEKFPKRRKIQDLLERFLVNKSALAKKLGISKQNLAHHLSDKNKEKDFPDDLYSKIMEMYGIEEYENVIDKQKDIISFQATKLMIAENKIQYLEKERERLRVQSTPDIDKPDKKQRGEKKD